MSIVAIDGAAGKCKIVQVKPQAFCKPFEVFDEVISNIIIHIYISLIV